MYNPLNLFVRGIKMAKKVFLVVLSTVLGLSLVISSCSIISGLKSNKPSGIYKASVMGIAQTLTFKSNNTLEINDDFSGKQVGKYSISADGQSITVTNIVTNEVGTVSFKYIKEQECVVFAGVAYFK